MPTSVNTTEAEKKPSRALEALDTIDQQQSQEARAGMQAVQEAAGEVQSEVADIMREKSEKVGERGEKRDIGTKMGGVKKDDDDDQKVVVKADGQVKFPSQPLMVSKVVKAIRNEIKLEMKRASRLEKKLAIGSAKDYNESIARIRTLKSVLQSALHATVDFLKDLYVRFVVDGKNRDKTAMDHVG